MNSISIIIKLKYETKGNFFHDYWIKTKKNPFYFLFVTAFALIIDRSFWNHLNFCAKFLIEPICAFHFAITTIRGENSKRTLIHH